MNEEEVVKYFLSFNGAVEEFPFGPEVAVYKVGGKMFALINEGKTSINLKNDPNENEMLRLEFEGISPGYHMNKAHWNTVELALVDDEIVRKLIEQSYKLVYMKLSKKTKEDIDNNEL